MNKITEETSYSPLLVVIIDGGDSRDEKYLKSLGREVFVGGGGRRNDRYISVRVVVDGEAWW